MIFIKKMCVLRQMRSGFSGDGKQVGGVVKAEQYGKSFRCKNGRRWAYPKHYASGIEAMRKSWCADKLIEL